MTKDRTLWKRRFLLFAIARISGVLLILIGMAAGLTDWITPGGWRYGGAAMIVIGTIEMVIVPILLRNAWKRE